VVSSPSGARRIAVFALALVGVAGACGDVRIYPLRYGSTDAGADIRLDTPPPPPIICPTSMVGWAKLPGIGDPTTGGAGGDAVVASTPEQLIAYAAADAPLVIQVRGLLTLTAPVEFTSNKTIYGDPETQGSGITGAGLNLTDASNIIVRNLIISKAIAGEGDAITLLRSKHVWIDHCDLSSEQAGGNYDGLADITHASDYITISWTDFHDHRDTSLVGHSENNMDEDMEHLTVTYHHNRFARVFSGPRIRFGSAHVYNNWFEEINAAGSFAVASESFARVLVEKNVFKAVATPITTSFMDANAGSAWDAENDYMQSPTPNIIAVGPRLVPPYAWAPTDTESLMALIPLCTGVGKIDDPLVIGDD
jgi:pectate lyase